MGRPPHWFTQLLIDHLRAHWQVNAQLFDGDGDVAIGHDASKVNSGVTIVSTDADFLALVPKDDVTLLSPQGPYTVSKRAVLKHLRVTSEQLAIAYLSSGCDNVSWKPKNFGFRAAIKIVKGCTVNALYETQVAKRVDAGERAHVTAMFAKVRQVLATFGWRGL